MKSPRRLAAPFVITLASVSACAPAVPPTEPEPDTGTTATATAAVDVEPSATAPAVATELSPAGTQTASASAPRVDEASLPDAPKTGGKLVRRADGTCVFERPLMKCPPMSRCNPPPPEVTPVKCPPATESQR